MMFSRGKGLLIHALMAAAMSALPFTSARAERSGPKPIRVKNRAARRGRYRGRDRIEGDKLATLALNSRVGLRNGMTFRDRYKGSPA